MSLRGKSVEELELELARMALYRANPHEQTHSASMVQLAGKLDASLSAIRETVQRFYALGLMRAVQSRGLVLEPVQTCDSADVLGLRMRAARAAGERRAALKHYVATTQHVLAAGLAASLDGDPRNVQRMRDGLRNFRGCLLFHPRTDIAQSFFNVVFDAGYLSDVTVLHWAAAGLWRNQSAFAPWVTAAWEGRSDEPAWTALAERYESADRAALAGAVAAAIQPFSERLLPLASETHPIAAPRPYDLAGSY